MNTPHYIEVLDKLILDIRALMNELPETDLASLATLTGSSCGDVSIGRLAVNVSEERRAKEQTERQIGRVARVIFQSDRRFDVRAASGGQVWDDLDDDTKDVYLANARDLAEAGLLA